MRKVLLAVMMLAAFASSAFAEASFDQIQGLIKAHDYEAAVQGLTVIIQNHPRSAKAYYAMSQAQAGVGNQAKAKEALDMARGLDPSLKFAPSGSVDKLKEAIQPQTKKIEAIESHTLRNCLILLLIVGGVAYFFYRRRKGTDDAPKASKPSMPDDPIPPQSYQNAHNAAAASAAWRTGNPALRAYTPPPAAPAPPAPVHHTTVVNGGGSSDLVTGMVLGSMMSGSHHHEHNTVVEREYVRETVREPEPRVSASWDYDTPSTSSSWDSGSSSSSSWDSGGSSSSSWDSGSSDSSSSSSWDD